MIRASGEGRLGFIVPTNIPEPDESILVAPIDYETSLEARVEATGLKYWSDTFGTQAFPGPPSRALVRLSIDPALAASLGDAVGTGILDSLARGAVESQSGDYILYKAAFIQAGGDAADFETDFWFGYLELARQAVEDADSLQQPLDETVGQSVDDDTQALLENVTNVAPAVAACGLVLSKQTSTAITAFNTPPSVTGAAFEVTLAERAITLLGVHASAWTLGADAFEAATGVVRPTGVKQPSEFVSEAVVAMEAIASGTSVTPVGTVWFAYEAGALTFMQFWLDDAGFGDGQGILAGTEIFRPNVTQDLPELLALRLLLVRTEAGLAASAAAAAHQAYDLAATQQLDALIPPISVIPAGGPEIAFLGCTSFMARVNSESAAQ